MKNFIKKAFIVWLLVILASYLIAPIFTIIIESGV